jgi:uncharacterized protein
MTPLGGSHVSSSVGGRKVLARILSKMTDAVHQATRAPRPTPAGVPARLRDSKQSAKLPRIVAQCLPKDYPMTDAPVPAYPVDTLNRVKRRPERGHYEHETVHRLLDAAALAHVSYVVDGWPLCTPTLFWREGSRLYWHGSNSSRMLKNLAAGEPACLTVTHFDSLVLARCGFNHSADYRSVMAFGHARLVEEPAHKRRALTMMVDRFFPERTAGLRPSNEQEINATTVLAMDIEQASAKIRAKGVVDDDDDYALPIYAERIPLTLVCGTPQPCPRLLPGVRRPVQLDRYRAGARLDEAVLDAYRTSYRA